jgi:hypothetical protein
MIALARDPDIERAREAATFYQTMGWNPLPSDPALGHPPYTYTSLRDSGAPDRIWDHFPLPCVQVPTGRRWGLVVIDLDGEVARDAWQAWTLHRPIDPTWTVESPRGGLHLWFEVPRAGAPIPWRFLWRLPDPSRKDGWAKHEGIELLGDGRLAMAPPSYRIGPGGRRREYSFTAGKGPSDIGRPAPLPSWVLELPGVEQRREAEVPAAPPHRASAKAPRLAPKGQWSRDAVLAAIPDKVALARSWGLRIVGNRPNSKGWVRCRAIGREDRHASAGFNAETGYYCEPGACRVSLFRLAVVLGRFAMWQQACNAIGAELRVPRCAPPLHEGKTRSVPPPACNALSSAPGLPSTRRPPGLRPARDPSGSRDGIPPTDTPTNYSDS